MSTLFQYLAEQGGVLLAAATCLLAIGCVGVALQRSPIHRQRAGEMAILGVLGALILACVPLPRYRLPDLWPAGSVAPNSLRRAEAVESPPPVFGLLDEPPLAELTVEDGPPMPADRLPSEVGTAADRSGVAVVMLPEPREPPAMVEPEPLPNTELLQPTPDGDRTTVTVGRSSSVGAAPALELRYPLSIGYIAGMLGCLVWLAFGRVLLVRMLWSARPPESWLREVYQQLPFARRRRPRLLISERCTRAMSFGIWRPTIVLPGVVCRADRAEALRYVLLHELAHARQRDGWGHLLFNAAFPLLYFHPLYWWIRSRAYLAAELIADDWAAGRRTKESYVEVLVALAKGGGRGQLACLSSPQIFGSRSQFYRRMQMLLDRETRLARRCSPLWRLIYPIACLAAVALVAGAAGVRPAEAQSDGAATPAVQPAAVALPAVEDTATPPADPDRIDIDALRAERDELGAERDQLRAELQYLKKMVETLRAKGAVSRSAYSTADTHKIFVALKDIPFGQLLSPQVLRLENWPEGKVPSGALSQIKDIEGRRTRIKLYAGEPILENKLLPKGASEQGYSMVIPKGHRMVSVKVDEATEGKFLVGDHVDVLINPRVLPNLGVLTVDGVLEDIVIGYSRSGRPDSAEPATVGLVVTPAQLEKVSRRLRSAEADEPPRAEQGKVRLLHRKTASPTTTGQVMTSAEPKPTPSVPVLRRPTVGRSRITSVGRPMDLPGAVAQHEAAEGTRLDLVRLATSYADAVGELEIAKLELEGRKELAERKAVSAHELAIAEIKLKNARRKVRLLQSIAESAIMATQAEMEVAKTRLDQATKKRRDASALQAMKSEVVRAESRLRILDSILESAGR